VTIVSDAKLEGKMLMSSNTARHLPSWIYDVFGELREVLPQIRKSALLRKIKAWHKFKHRVAKDTERRKNSLWINIDSSRTFKLPS
jgi:hypothetical protein